MQPYGHLLGEVVGQRLHEAPLDGRTERVDVGHHLAQRPPGDTTLHQ